MRIHLRTTVNGHFKKVFSHFDRDLFRALLPPIGKTEIVEFTGSKKGDRVHIRFLSPVKAEWVSTIVEDKITKNDAYFVDIGEVLPFGIKEWTHIHRVLYKSDQQSIIEDDIVFEARNRLWGAILYPGLWLSFWMRKPIYKKYFSSRKNM